VSNIFRQTRLATGNEVFAMALTFAGGKPSVPDLTDHIAKFYRPVVIMVSAAALMSGVEANPAPCYRFTDSSTAIQLSIKDR